ncbi:MAG: hypothetical protein U1D55_09915 [Phycisphaerae bacterium]
MNNEDSVTDAPPETTAGGEIARLVRTHNTQLFMVIVSALTAVGFVQTAHIFSEAPPFLEALTWGRIALLAAVLASNATTTALAIRRARSDATAPPERAALREFVRAKTIATWSLAMAADFCAVSLLFGHRTMDALIALAAFLLLWMARPNPEGLASFQSTIQGG